VRTDQSRVRSGVYALAFALSCGVAWPSGGARAADAVTQERLLNVDREPGNWLHHHRDYGAQRFSPLDQVTSGNVRNLKVAWTMALGGIEGGGIWPHGGLEGTPIAENGTLYVTDGWGSVYRIEAPGGRPRLVWKMDPKTDRDWSGAVACCGVNNRGVALWQNLIVSHSLDGRLIATDKATGNVVWQRQVADPAKGETITGAPLIVNGRAITGVGGAEYGIRGWLAATDLASQKEVWRTHTIPGPGEPGAETWRDTHNAWATGGGSTWVTGSYEPGTNTLYWGVGNPGPDWDHEYRPGDNLFTNTTLALDPDTGRIKWHFQHTPNDPYDYDAVAEKVLIDLPAAGNRPAQRLALTADRNGFAYALDRASGNFVWGLPFVKRVNWTTGLNAETGMPNEYIRNAPLQPYVAASIPNRANQKAEICPGNMGGKNWPPTAYNPNLRLWYIPVIESCNTITNQVVKPGEFKPREFFTGGGPSQHERITGSITAIDVTTGKIAGKVETQFPQLGGFLATRDLLFGSHPDGEVFALDAKTLEKLWSFQTGGGANAPPMTYMADGKQFIAILVGLGGAWPKWFVESTPELKAIAPGSTLYVFAL